MTGKNSVKAYAALLLCGLMVTSMLVMLPGGARAAPTDSWIEGTITDGSNPIDNVYLLLMPMISNGDITGTGWTDASGHYNVSVIGGLQYIVMGFRGGYYGVNGSATANPGETAVLDFVMRSVAPTVEDVVIQGYVVDELSNPVTVGTVIGYASDPANMGQGPPVYGNVTTLDGLGYYTVNIIPSAIGGGAAVFDVPGYPMQDSTSSNPFVSGMTYWFNITLQAQTYTDDAVIYGFVTDASTGLPLENAMISFESWNQWNQNRSYSNMTFTDSSGFYVMNVTNGTANIWISRSGYSMYQYSDVSVSNGSMTQFDAALLPTTATIKGKITDGISGSPIANARVFLVDSYSDYSMALTNGSGDYVMQAFNGTGLMLGAEADGYGRNMTMVDVYPGDVLWYNFTLRSMDAWLAGRVTDSFSGLPIQGASVWVHSSNYSDQRMTDGAGEYNFTSFLSGHYTVDVNVMNYRTSVSEIDVLPGGNIYDVALMPMNLPRTCKLWGFVNDSGTLTGIQNAKVETGTGAPDYMEYNQTSTNMAGYYEMWVAPIDMLFVMSASNHMHAQGSFNATGMTEMRLDVYLDSDTMTPNVSYSQSPLENITWFNPTFYNIVVEDVDPAQFALAQLMYQFSMAGLDHYYLVAMNADNFNPLSQSANDLPFMQVGDNYTIMYSWDATITGGWLWNSSAQQYLGSWRMWWGPDMYDAIRCYYTNSSMMGPAQQGTAVFDGSTGAFLTFQFDNGGRADPSDMTGQIIPQVSEIRIDPVGGGWSWMGSVALNPWSVVGLNFQFEPVVPSGRYCTVFSASDFGGRVWGGIELFTVDNDPPVADAGPGQVVIVNTSATLDGSMSTDNVGIVNYTWSFLDNSVPIEVYGMTATYNFTEVGNHTVILTVRDGAGHIDSAMTYVLVAPDSPPVANAGPDQSVMGGELVMFDGTASDDDVGIVNWTWTFDYDGSPVVLYGPTPEFTFLIEGVYDVNLTVTDTAGQTATDTVQITVSGMIPEFPTLLLPVIGVAGLVLFVRLRKKK